MTWSRDDFGFRRLRVGAVRSSALGPAGCEVIPAHRASEGPAAQSSQAFRGPWVWPRRMLQVQYIQLAHHEEANLRSQLLQLTAFIRFLNCSGHHGQLCTVTCAGDMSSIPQVLHRSAKPVAVAEFVDAVQAICHPRFPGARGRQARPVGATRPSMSDLVGSRTHVMVD